MCLSVSEYNSESDYGYECAGLSRILYMSAGLGLILHLKLVLSLNLSVSIDIGLLLGLCYILYL